MKAMRCAVRMELQLAVSDQGQSVPPLGKVETYSDGFRRLLWHPGYSEMGD